MRLDCLSIPGKSRVVVHRRESVLLKGYFVAGSILIILTNNPNNILMNQGHCVKAKHLGGTGRCRPVRGPGLACTGDGIRCQTRGVTGHP